MSDLDLSSPTSVHVIGVGGAGMSAIASVLAWIGHDVSGSDLKESAGLDRLRALGVDVTVGHHPDNLGDATVVTRSTAVPDINSEVRATRERGMEVLDRATVLGAITRLRKTVAVAGTHGKTTISSMLSLALRESSMRPSFIIGGDVNEIGTGAAWDEGDWFVVEADESDGSFLSLERAAAIVSNIEPDHLEHHGGWDQLLEQFTTFVAETAGPVVVNADDPRCAELLAQPPAGAHVVGFGQSDASTFRVADLECGWNGSSFVLVTPDVSLPVTVPVQGEHNAMNAAAAATAAITIGADPVAVAEALGRFAGVARRFEHRGSAGGVTFVDDYAHLPSEVEAVVATAKTGPFDRLVVVFQPHRYSRTEALWPTFTSSFVGADEVYVTDIYASGEPARAGVSGRLIVDAIEASHPDGSVHFVAHRDDLVEALVGSLRAGDLCLTLGAGDLTTLPDVMRARLADG